MRRTFVMLCAVLFLGGCVEESSVSYKEFNGIDEIEKIPREIQKEIQPQYTLQKIQKAEGHYYIVFYSYNDVKANYVIGDEIFEIHLDENRLTYEDQQLYIYEIIVDNGPKKIEVYLEGEAVEFDKLTVI